MHKLDIPKRVTLPNGRTFVARYKRISRSQLPANIVWKRTYRQWAAPRGRRRQWGRGLFSFIKKVAKNPAIKSLAKQCLKHLPALCNTATSRIKNDKLKKALQSDTAHRLLNKVIDRYND